MKQTRQLTILLLLVLACIGRVAGQGKVYWLKNNAGTISRANIDGTTTETLVTGALCADGAFISSSLGKVMWVEGCGKMALKIADLDGTNVQILDTFNTTGRQISPRGVTYDESTGNIYVIGAGGFARGNISSLPLTATQTFTISGRAIAINSATGKLYFSTQNDNKIKVMNTDGTGIDTIRTNLSTSWGVQVDADNGKVYFADGLGIYKTNLDGTGFQTVYTFPASLTFTSIAIDVRNDRLFWASNGGVINKATLGGLNPTQIITGQGGIFAITIGASSSRQASNINFNTITANSTNAIFKKGNGAGRVAFLKADTLSVPVPVDGTTYTGNAAFGSGTQIGTSGWFCVYSGTDSTVSITGLAANTTYRMMVMEYSGTGSNIDYNVTYANLNPNKFRTGGVSITPPTVLTVGAASIASTSAVLRGNVTASGGASVTERGVVYSTTANPTIATATKRAIGFNVGTYANNITGLSSATLYHFRAYAINSVGTSYGADSTFTTLAGAPSTELEGDTSSKSLNKGSFGIVDNSLTITTVLDSISGANVTITNGLQTNDSIWYNGSLPIGITASYNRTKGILTFNGKAKAADFQALLRNVTIKMPTVSTNATRTVAFTLGTAIPYNGHYFETVTTPLTWVNAKAAAAARSYFGLQGYLVTVKDANENDYIRQKLSSDAWMGASDNYIQINAATGTTTFANQAAAEGKWYWVTGPEAGQQFSNGNYPSTTVISGKYMNWDGIEPNNFNGSEDYGQFYSSGAGKWNDFPGTSSLSYVCEYGDMAGDPSVTLSYSRNIIPIPVIAPTVQTSSTSLITFNSATLSGNVSDSGTATVAERGVVYATTINPTTANTKVIIGSGLGTFSQNVTGLIPSTLYHVRAYAINSVGTSYGADSTFTTLSAVAPTVLTGNISSIGITNATLGGNVSDSGTAAVTERGVVYATIVNPTTANTKVAIGLGLGTFSQNVTGLLAATTYHVRAYAINSVGTSYGADSVFTTLPAPTVANVITSNVTAISNTSATLAGSVTADGGATVTERGIVLATTVNPTTANTKVNIGSGLGNFSQNITALTPNTTYYYRAYAINSVGTSYGVDSVFTTLPNPEFNKNITNAFSPDGNGTNDTWVIDNADMLDGHEITIYNIFGQVIFSQTGYNTPWDGKKDGNLVPSGEYYYQIKGSKVNIKGALLIKTHQ